MIKILIVSRSPWRSDNSFGNTYSNFFSNMKDVKIANIYLAEGKPEYEENVTDYFQITEKNVIDSFFNRKKICGKREYSTSKDINTTLKESESIKVAKKLRWQIFYMTREVIWMTGKWNTNELSKFVSDFNPDVIFQPFYYALYPNRVALYFSKKFKIPMVLEASIDIYTLLQISFSPLYWIDRFAKRTMVRKMIRNGKLLYVISDKQKKDYSKFFDIECKVLNKNASVESLNDINNEENKTIRNDPLIVYTGNLGDGRWKTVALVAKAVEAAGVGRLEIYSHTVLKDKVVRMLNRGKFSSFMGAVSGEEAKRIQSQADILLHIESFNLKSKLAVRYSISTKIMDYLSKGKCVLAIGPKDIASMEYLKKNGCVYSINKKSEIMSKIKNLLLDKKKILSLSNSNERCESFYIDQTAMIRADLSRISGRD